MRKTGNQVLGVDASKDGWMVVEIGACKMAVNAYQHFTDVMQAYARPSRVLIDVPVGLPFTKEEAEHRPEKEARKKLPGRASTIFTVPCMQAATQENYVQANRCNKAVLNKGISMQSFNIMKKTLEVHAFLAQYPSSIPIIKEAHPELQFAQFTEKKLPIQACKKTTEGILEREALVMKVLERYTFIQTPLHSLDLFKKYPDDVLDAMCLAIAALLGETYGFTTIPEDVVENHQGIPMAMIYYSI